MTTPAPSLSSSDRQVTFGGRTSKRSHGHTEQDFIGRVPVVLSFVGLPTESTDGLIRELDASLHRFSEQRVQLIAVTDSDPQAWADRLGVNITILQDADLATDLGAHIDDEGRIASVITDNEGWELEIVRHDPTDDLAAALLVALDRLRKQFPDRLSALPDSLPEGVAVDSKRKRIVDAD